MSAIFRRTASGCSTGTLSSQPHRPHRHKKFHVRPEALGESYETYDVLTQSSSPSPADFPAAPSIPEAEGIAANAPVPAAATLACEWTKLSEKETSFLAARSALRFWCCGVLLLSMLVLLCANGGWLRRIVDWLLHFPTLTG